MDILCHKGRFWNEVVVMAGAVGREAEKERFELIDGKVVLMSPRPRINHARISGAIYFAFARYLQGKRCEPFCDGVDVYLDEKNHFIPDVMIVCNPDQVKETHIEGAPALVVEVLSVSTQFRDRGVKMHAYAAAGVQEYWLVNPNDKSIEVYLNHEGTFVLDNIYNWFTEEQRQENDAAPVEQKLAAELLPREIPVSLYDDFRIPLADIFARI
ncbi:MAG TPA: hypothetical protein DEA67_06180 [Selenomonas sp.]|jgi:Uma2 family endonuclease|nr:hypothetical protein [Selenomonas sp.]